MRIIPILIACALSSAALAAEPQPADTWNTGSSTSGGLPSWLGRTEFQLPLVTGRKPAFSVLTVIPVYNQGQHYIFNQSRVSYNGDDRLTGNIGFGYRYLTRDERAFYGINAFYDFEKPYDHSRAGMGVEWRTSAFEANANYYLPLSGWQAAGTGFEEHALRGYDAELGGQVPYMPWAWIFAKGYRYESEIADVDDITGVEYALRLRPTQNIEVEGGYNDSDGTDGSSFVRLSYRVGFGEVQSIKKRGLFSPTPFEIGESMKPHIYDKIRRSNDITVQRRSTTEGGDPDGATAVVRVSIGS